MTDARDFFGYKHPDEEPARPDLEDEDEDDELAPPPLDEAITLDDPTVLKKIDPQNMLGAVQQLPRQLVLARRVAEAVQLPDRYRDLDAVLVLAMGGSAIGAELVEAIAGPRLRVPLVVHHGYGLPEWANQRTLVIAASHSGETVETLSGASEAQRRGLPLAVISTGGRLGELAGEHGLPYLRYQMAGQPRSAVGFGVGLMHDLLARAGVLADPDAIGPAVEALDALLERNDPSMPTDDNAAKQLAWSLFGRMPVIYGAGPMTPVAHRWKTQLNENAKAWASYEPMPEANHNAIEGSLNPRELGDAPYVVQVRDPEEPAEIAARYRAVEELLGERATNRSIVWAEGPSRLARVLTAVAYGDLTSVYLAILYQTDPTPVTLLAMLKERLARAST
ncbi:MAG TPA: bifunctional phosphoglucose/phosphomannose isomerase [Candidatus Limnocylindria bacterium]|nr:bifunctional phosphoglucose/phosphomannose isomerase [Candidatus Limnocylindria bacterium]